MTELSIKAKEFLSKHNRTPSTVIREEIIASFIANNAPVFEPLIEFQQKYSGYEFMAGLEPIHFGLLQGDGGYPIRTGTAIIDFSLDDIGNSKYQFICATSLYQKDFTLDEFGHYYEDYEIVASSFDKVIEHLTIWEELKKKPRFKVLLRNEIIDIPDLDKKLGLSVISEASDEFTIWYKNENIYMTQTNGETTIITSEDFDKINRQIGD